jgi:hypothetical protein
MAKSASKKPKATVPQFEPDAWARFERAMAVVVKSPPQHKTKTRVPIPKKRKLTKNVNSSFGPPRPKRTGGL